MKLKVARTKKNNEKITKPLNGTEEYTDTGETQIIRKQTQMETQTPLHHGYNIQR